MKTHELNIWSITNYTSVRRTLAISITFAWVLCIYSPAYTHATITNFGESVM